MARRWDKGRMVLLHTDKAAIHHHPVFLRNDRTSMSTLQKTKMCSAIPTPMPLRLQARVLLSCSQQQSRQAGILIFKGFLHGVRKIYRIVAARVPLFVNPWESLASKESDSHFPAACEPYHSHAHAPPSGAFARMPPSGGLVFQSLSLP